MKHITKTLGIAGLSLALAASCAAQKKTSVWLTTPNGTKLLEQQKDIRWKSGSLPGDRITIDDAQSYQTMDGFGHALTGGSAQLLMQMSASARHALLKELFGHGKGQLNTSYIRISVGASDMNGHVYTYDDLPVGQTDEKLAKFSLGEDLKDVVPVLKEILKIQPSLHILASPWTAPAWMKSNGEVKGGSLKHEYYAAFAQYWVLYLQAMGKQGIRIETLTVENEPENPKNTPSMVMSAEEQAEFIGKYLGPALKQAGLGTKIVAFDHNCDHPQYPETVLRDAAAGPYTDGSGFHLYLGEISTLSQVHMDFPAKNIYFTEQMVVAGRATEVMPIARPLARVVIGATENWSRNVLLWNLAADAKNGPHTNNGGCPVCTGAITIDGDHLKRLVAYYTAAHASRFVPSGSVRVDSRGVGTVPPHVAFRTPDGHHVMIASNPGKEDASFAVTCRNHSFPATLKAGEAATYVW
jgi:glucosylceramidase